MQEHSSIIGVEKGITLIALVVTIIVLLILAGVSVNLVVGQNGIITRANEAKEVTRAASIEERANLWKLDIEAVNLIGSGIVQSLDEVLAELQTEGLLTAEEVTSIKQDENKEIKIGSKTISFETETQVPALKGSVTYKEGSIEEGLVVTDASSNEFVWIPVENVVAEDEVDIATMISSGKYPMAVKTDVVDGVQNYRGVLYDFGYDEINNKVTITPIENTEEGYREPAYLTDETDGDASSYNPLTEEEFSEETLQAEFNTMVEKVKVNGGFYIGRYETSYNGTVVESKADKVQMSEDSQSWWGMYEKKKGLTNGSITSSMIWGSQWDQVMIWMKDVTNPNSSSKPFYIIDSTGMGNYADVDVYDSEGTNIIKASGTYSRLNTGITTFTKVKNIYDLAENMWEWTMEVYSSNNRVGRGGSYVRTGSDYPASNRMSNYPSHSVATHGSRLVLY